MRRRKHGLSDIERYRPAVALETIDRFEREYNFRPNGPNQQWHVDRMYVWVAARFYFLVSFVDAYSRYIVHHKLLMSLDGKSMAIDLQTALENSQGIKPRVVHDHGSEFVNRDVAAVIMFGNAHTGRRVSSILRCVTRVPHNESYGFD